VNLDYESSRDLAQLAGVMLSEPDLPSALRRVTELAAGVVPRCDGASLTMRKEGRPVPAAADGDWASGLDDLQHREQEGPCIDCLREGSVMRVRDLAGDSRFPTYGPRAAERGAHAVVSMPLAADGRTVGALNLYSRQADAFDGAGLALAELLAAHASLAVQAATAYYTNRDLAEQMREAISSRAVIEQAKGVLVAQRGCPPEEAFRLLVAASQRSNRKLRDIAQEVVAGAARDGDGAGAERTG
jgi:GAF domain-containing protein